MPQKRIIIVLGILILVCTPLFSQTLKEKAERGDKVAQFQYARKLEDGHLKGGDYQEALLWLQKSADQGYAPAQCDLGYHYGEGLGIQKDKTLAVYWYRKAAEQGDAIAQFNLGVCYSNGEGVEKSHAMAFSWYKKAADQGHANAEYSVGRAYYYGIGVLENNQLAIEWFLKAANQKHPRAMYYLGECYSHGYGVIKDMAKAIEWYENGSDVSETKSQYALACLYLKGDGVEKDSIHAVDLLLRSACGGECSPHQLFLYDKKNANDSAKKKLLELSSLNKSPKQYYFMAMAGCLYGAMQDYPNAEKYFKRSIELGGYLGVIELGLMYFYIAANVPQLNPYYNKEGGEEWLGLESYMLEDNAACLEYVKSKEWTDTDNVVYWFEKALSYGLDPFLYGVMEYSLYDYLLFIYVDEIGGKRDLGRAIDISVQCLTDTTAQYGRYTAIETMEIALNKVEFQPQIFQTYVKSYKSLQGHLNEENKWLYYNMAAGLGKCYYKGMGTEKNYNLAFKYLFEAANNNICESMRLLAACYRYGRGTSVNKTKECEWVEKAAACGDEKANRIKKSKN